MAFLNLSAVQLAACLGGSTLLISLATLLRKSQATPASWPPISPMPNVSWTTYDSPATPSRSNWPRFRAYRHQEHRLDQQKTLFAGLNETLQSRETGLHTLLESSRWMRGDLAQDKVMDTICRAAVQVMGSSVSAAAILSESKGQLSLAGQHGFGPDGAKTTTADFASSFAGIVLKQQHNAFIEDLERHPETNILQPSSGRTFRSVLGIRSGSAPARSPSLSSTANNPATGPPSKPACSNGSLPMSASPSRPSSITMTWNCAPGSRALFRAEDPVPRRRLP